MKVVRPGVILVAARELRWMVRDRLALFLAIGVPIIAFALLSWTFSSAVIRDLRISVVDNDRTPTSSTYVQAVAAAPGVQIATRSDDLTSAMHGVRSGDAVAVVYIAANFERDLNARKRPQIVVFYNRQYLTPGNNAASAISAAVAAATATLDPSPAVTGRAYSPGAIVVEQYVLTNPALNYIQFLLRSILPTVLHIVVAIAAGYAVGSEFSRRRRSAWMRAAGGRPLAAIIGKLLPLFGIFVLMMVLEAGIIHGIYHVPFRGNAMMMAVASCLLLIAYLALGSLFALVTRNLALGLSLSAVVCSPAFGFVGIGFPILAMNGFAQFWSALLPLRWYFEILFDQAVRGLPTSASAGPFAILALMALLFSALAWLGTKSVANQAPIPEPAEAASDSVPGQTGVVAAMLVEGRRVINDSGVRGLIILAPVLYGIFYPQPYLGELLRDLPISVVDQDNTELSRDLIQTLDAHEAIRIAVRADTLADAKTALAKREVSAIVGIPQGTEREILKGNRALLPVYVDSAYFLLYSETLGGIVEASGVASQAMAAHGARADGSLAYAGLIRQSPVELLTEPLFNPTGGYASYVVPAAFVLIVQQTLLMGAATSGGVAFEQGGIVARRRRSGFRAILGQALAHLLLALPGLALYLIVLPRIYGFSTLGRLPDLCLMIVPFVLSVSFMAQFVSAWFERRETAILIFIATSLPLFFVVGVSWPLEAIPGVLRAASRLMPSIAATDGLVRINQMGASLHDVSRDWLTLWLLAAFYGLLAVVASKFLRFRERVRDV